MKTFKELREINVNEYVEKKGQLKYLSWVWSVDILLQNDPDATWEFPEPKYFGETVMVYCNVTAMGKTMRMQLPVMDNRNSAIPNPDTRKISDATMRCLAKCIACFGIGLYIYAGEDWPETDEDDQSIDIEPILNAIKNSDTLNNLKKHYIAGIQLIGENNTLKRVIDIAKDARKAELGG